MIDAMKGKVCLVALLSCLAGCSTIGYYAQSISGHLGIINRARPIEDVLADPAVAGNIKEKLRYAQRARDFASRTLGLPDNGSYREYADLARPYAVWNVFATPELSLQARQWCFLVVGCVAYRGYFAEPDARAFAEGIAAAGDDVYVGGVAAYSTLGWFDDPLLNTLMRYDDIELAGLIFHELAHQVAYARDDTVFNESFATVVELAGVDRWLATVGDTSGADAYRARTRRRDEVIALIMRYREELARVYESGRDDEWKRGEKKRLLQAMQDEFSSKTADWPGMEGFRRWFAQPVNNAQLLSVAAYYDWVPALQNLLARNEGDMRKFYRAAVELAALETGERGTRLKQLEGPAHASTK